MRIPKPERARLADLVRSVGQVYIHELMHNYGQRHKDMLRVSWIDVSFLEGYKLEHTIPEKKTKQKATDADKLAKVQKLLDKWNKKQKNCMTFIRKYKKKVRYYERKIKKAAFNLKEQNHVRSKTL